MLEIPEVQGEARVQGALPTMHSTNTLADSCSTATINMGATPAALEEAAWRILCETPGDLAAWELVTECRIRQGKVALLRNQDVAYAEPARPEFRRRFAPADLPQGQNVEWATAVWQREAARRPYGEEVRYNFGCVLLEQKAWAQAAAEFRCALHLNPRFAQAQSQLGVALRMLGEITEGLNCCRTATEWMPESALAHGNLAAALRDSGQSGAALHHVRLALTIDPEFADGHRNLGNLLLDAGQYADAVNSYRRCLEVSPSFARAHSNLGTVLRALGRLDEAADCYRRALECDPGLSEARTNLGVVLSESGQTDEALCCLGAALEFPATPNNAKGSDFASAVNVIIEAMASFNRVLDDRSDYRRLHFEYEKVLNAKAGFERAVAAIDSCLSLVAKNAKTFNSLSAVLVEQGRIGEAVEALHCGLSDDISSKVERSAFIALKNYLPGTLPDELFEDAYAFGCIARRSANIFTSWPNDPHPDRCLNVGFVSGDLRDHPVGYFVVGLFESLLQCANGRVNLYVYATTNISDTVSKRIRACCSGWSDVASLSDESFARLVRDDRIDVLIDLVGHTSHNRLTMFAWKAAPVQVTWLGYLATTGVKEIDYLIADKWTLPVDQERFFVERIWRLPESYVTFAVPDGNTPLTPLPALATGTLTFGVFNNPIKVNDEVISLWAIVLQAVPGSRLLFKAKSFKFAEARQRMAERFSAFGIGPDRLLMEAWIADRGGRLDAYQKIDISLDTFPYPGITTTVESLWMGVPVLTLAGRSFLTRQGVGLLMNSGLSDWIAHDRDEFVSLAKSHVCDLEKLAVLRSRLRERVGESSLFNPLRFADHFEAALRGMWSSWCAGSVSEKQGTGRGETTKKYIYLGQNRRSAPHFPEVFHTPDWHEFKHLEGGLATAITELSCLDKELVDAIFLDQAIVQLHPHEVPGVMAALLRVLNPSGFIIVSCPDLQAICQRVADGLLLAPLSDADQTGLTPLDELFGLREAIQQGDPQAPHRCGFTENALAASLSEAGFSSIVSGTRGAPHFDLWALASKNPVSEEQASELADVFFPN